MFFRFSFTVFETTITVFPRKGKSKTRLSRQSIFSHRVHRARAVEAAAGDPLAGGGSKSVPQCFEIIA